MKRVFFAVDIEPGPQLLEAFDLTRYRLRLEKINWVSAKQLHITLAFLGEIPTDLVPSVIRDVESGLALLPGFRITITSLGVFKNLQNPNVIWAGCEAPAEFPILKKILDGILAGHGYIPETRPFSPHLTLGRIKDLKNHNQLAQVITLYRGVVFQQQNIRKVVFYESRLSPAGPEYLVLKEFPLTAVPFQSSP